MAINVVAVLMIAVVVFCPVAGVAFLTSALGGLVIFAVGALLIEGFNAVGDAIEKSNKDFHDRMDPPDRPKKNWRRAFWWRQHNNWRRSGRGEWIRELLESSTDNHLSRRA